MFLTFSETPKLQKAKNIKALAKLSGRAASRLAPAGRFLQRLCLCINLYLDLTNKYCLSDCNSEFYVFNYHFSTLICPMLNFTFEIAYFIFITSNFIF